MKTGFVYDLKFLEHETGFGHPECNSRLSTSISYLKKQVWFNKLINTPARNANIEDVLNVHTSSYIKRFKKACLLEHDYLDSADVPICHNSYNTALLAAGSGLQLADKIINKEINNGFAMLRPPGHHAEKEMAYGFCMFNNISILARYLQTKHGVDKIAIVDWDVHHGNGTQHLFEEDPSILYISIHQYPHYPGTGNYTETGIGRGKGSILNCNMHEGSGDAEYKQAFFSQILPKIDEFIPDFILISAGFDAHYADPLGGINLNESSFAWMTNCLMEKAEKYCANRIISLLEGGYNLNALAMSIDAHFKTLLQE